MGPAILARAAVGPFAAKIHGSALEYTVKPHPRFLPYAYEGMEAATGVLVGSGHTAESLWAALPELSNLREKTRLGPPGVDVEEFQPAVREPDGEGGLRSHGPALVVFVGKLIVS
jgi:glycosyltransferase involved in cell wall biosynthesis